MKTGQIFKHKTLGDEVAIAMVTIPIALRIGKSPNFHDDDYIDVRDGDWELTNE